jgi:hypothetical protein
MPAGTIEVGITVALAFGFRCVPRETALGEGESGVLKGWAALVDVAGGGWSRGVVSGSRERELRENERGVWDLDRRADARRRQVRQIMVGFVGEGSGLKLEFEVYRTFLIQGAEKNQDRSEYQNLGEIIESHEFAILMGRYSWS